MILYTVIEVGDNWSLTIVYIFTSFISSHSATLHSDICFPFTDGKLISRQHFFAWSIFDGFEAVSNNHFRWKDSVVIGQTS